MATKKVKIKVTEKRINIKKILCVLIILATITLGIIYFIHRPLKNIYINGNNILSDKEIIELSGLSDYPPYINTYFMNIKGNLYKNDYIKEVTIKRNIAGKIYIKIKEYTPVAIYKNELILSSKEKVTNNYNINYVPYISNDIDAIYDKTIEAFTKIKPNILFKISHIEYVPNEVDTERFLLYMVDSNYVYITLTKIDKINKYNSIINKLEGKKGIIYLDSGDCVEIKD